MPPLIPIAAVILSAGVATMSAGNPAPPAPSKPFATMQAVPLPYEQVSFQRDGAELARYHYGHQLKRPFLFPLIGPAGRIVTRMGHPHDPMGHSHHNSVWISHQNVNGVNFWEDPNPARIVHQAIEQLGDGPDAAVLQVRNAWRGPDDKPILNEHRRMTLRPLPGGEWTLTVELLITPSAGDVTFGKTSFGLFAVRVAKTMDVADGGGTILNSAGGVNEKEVFWKPARWVDYSGRVTPDRQNGITLMDHPSNPNHPSVFHVRNDGWMGAAFTFNAPYVLAAGGQLRLMYALYVHDGPAEPARIDERFVEFAAQRPQIR